MNEEVEMSTNHEQKTARSQKKYLWFGFGNYSGQPIQQIGGGIVRDPNLLEDIGSSAAGRSPLVSILAAVIGFTLFVILLVWGISLLVN